MCEEREKKLTVQELPLARLDALTGGEKVSQTFLLVHFFARVSLHFRAFNRHLPPCILAEGHRPHMPSQHQRNESSEGKSLNVHEIHGRSVENAKNCLRKEKCPIGRARGWIDFLLVGVYFLGWNTVQSTLTRSCNHYLCL